MIFPFKRFFIKYFYPYYFEQIVFFVTARCNMMCSMCFYHDESKNSNKKSELTIDEIKKITSNLKPFYVLNIAGGEPFIRDDLDQICEYFITKSKVGQVILPTNGWFTESIIKTMEILLKYKQTFFTIVISIDDIGEKHDKIRGLKGSFDKLKETYARLISLKQKYPNLSIVSNTTIMNSNEKRIVEILKFINNNFEFDDQIMTLARYKARDKIQLDITIENYYEGIRYLIQKKYNELKYKGITNILSKVFFIKDLVRYKTIIKVITDKTFYLICCAGKLALMINEEGKLCECEILKNDIGNLRDASYDLNKLYNGPMRKVILNKQIARKCTCTYECYLPFNLLFNTKSHYEIIKALIYSFILKCPEKYVGKIGDVVR